MGKRTAHVLLTIRSANNDKHAETLWQKNERPPRGHGELTPEQVREIRNPHNKPSAMAKKYGMKVESIKAIRYGINYAWVAD